MRKIRPRGKINGTITGVAHLSLGLVHLSGRSLISSLSLKRNAGNQTSRVSLWFDCWGINGSFFLVWRRPFIRGRRQRRDPLSRSTSNYLELCQQGVYFNHASTALRSVLRRIEHATRNTAAAPLWSDDPRMEQRSA